MIRLALLVAAALASLATSRLMAADVQVETVVDGLHHPTGIAIQPETGHVFVADSGALRVVRVVEGKIEEVVTGFSKDVYGPGPMYDIGPLGLGFQDKETLIVGGGGKPDGDDELFVFTIPKLGEKSIAADKPKLSFKLPAKGEVHGEGNFYGVAVTKTGVYVTGNGDDAQGWISKAEINGTKIENFERFIATRTKVEATAPVGITIGPRGDLVVGQMGKIDTPEDALVSFYSAKDGGLLANYKTGLFDITALAYSPKGQLYALDFAWMEPGRGGLFQLIADRGGSGQQVKAQQVVALERPTAMAFSPDGTLYVTVLGKGEKGAGALLKITPGL